MKILNVFDLVLGVTLLLHDSRRQGMSHCCQQISILVVIAPQAPTPSNQCEVRWVPTSACCAPSRSCAQSSMRHGGAAGDCLSTLDVIDVLVLVRLVRLIPRLLLLPTRAELEIILTPLLSLVELDGIWQLARSLKRSHLIGQVFVNHIRFVVLETAETDQDNVTNCNADLPSHFATNMAHTLYTIEAVRLEPGTSVHLEHLRVLLALIYILEVQLALAVAITLRA
mmetsp:Transcript_78254/g.114596  ORF Transcript_78254/g.114596 Transcript_78254/m.114596 type:complete len:226 (-) Transcript_78254:133-810(-)